MRPYLADRSGPASGSGFVPRHVFVI
jgi:hypothetical protein